MSEETENIEETAPEPVAEEAPAAQVEAAEAAPEAPAEKLPPIEVLAPSERRQRARAQKAAKRPAGAPRSSQERQADRDADRANKHTARKLERAQAREKYKASEHERVPTPPREHIPGAQKVRRGVVVSDKAAKTITVRIDVARRHRRYAKIVRTSLTLHAHDERGDAHIGDTVLVRECRPLSRTKRWRLVEVVERAK
jgi:small subunit ribosomal protein S17